MSTWMWILVCLGSYLVMLGLMWLLMELCLFRPEWREARRRSDAMFAAHQRRWDELMDDMRRQCSDEREGTR